MNKILNILNAVSLSILFIMVLLLIFTAFDPVKTLRLLNIMSGSMEPSIKTGSLAFSVRTDSEELKKGDIINYEAIIGGKTSVTHRINDIVKKDGTVFYRTKGDANNSTDADEIPQNMVKGKVLFSVPFLGYFAEWIRKPMGFIILVIFPASILILSEIINIKKSIEEEILKKYSLQRVNSAKKPDKGQGYRKLTVIYFVLLTNLILGGILFKVKPVISFFSDLKNIENNTITAGLWEASEEMSTVTASPPVQFEPTVTPESTPILTTIMTVSPTDKPRVVINEFMPNPSDEDEWVEIYNDSESSIQILNWIIADLQGPQIIITDSQINKKEYKVYSIGNKRTLNNDGDTILLKTESGIEIDIVTYPKSLVSTGVSIGRKPDGSGNLFKCASPSAGFSNITC